MIPLAQRFPERYFKKVTSPLFKRSPLILPLFIHQTNRSRVGLLVFLVGGTLYLLSNHFHFFTPKLLPMSWIDLNMPFWPNTFWIYNSEYLYFFLIYQTCRDVKNLNQYVYAFLGLLIASVAIFWIWPTIYPRDHFLLPDHLNAFTKYAFTQFRQLDTPANCCPSLHVSGVYLSAFVFLQEQRSKFFFFFTWGTLITLSTLTTKQHYFLDVISGFGMAALFHFIFHSLVRYRSPNGK